MSGKKQIIITVDQNGQAELETIGFKGKGCSIAIKEILSTLATTKKIKKKAEWFQEQPINIVQKE